MYLHIWGTHIMCVDKFFRNTHLIIFNSDFSPSSIVLTSFITLLFTNVMLIVSSPAPSLFFSSLLSATTFSCSFTGTATVTSFNWSNSGGDCVSSILVSNGFRKQLSEKVVTGTVSDTSCSLSSTIWDTFWMLWWGTGCLSNGSNFRRSESRATTDCLLLSNVSK